MVVLNRARGVGIAGGEGASSEESMMLMGMDGWVEQPGSSIIGQDANNNNNNNRMMEMEVQQEDCAKHDPQQPSVSALPPLPLAAATAAAWEKAMMENRARIIENEEMEFSHGFPSSSTASSSSSHTTPGNNNNNKRLIMSGKNTNRLFMEKVQAEATRKFQEQLASVAMTA